MPVGLNVNTAGAAENVAQAATQGPDAGLTEARGRLVTGNGVEQVHLTTAEQIPAPPGDTAHYATGAGLADYSPALAGASEVAAFDDFFAGELSKDSLFADFFASDGATGNGSHRTGLSGEQGTFNGAADRAADLRAQELLQAHQETDRLMGGRQYDPSGSPSRVAGAPELPVTARLDKNAADLFKRHGLPEPRKDIKIPILNITIIKRDTELKALLPRLEAAHAQLADYHDALNADLAAQTPGQRMETSVRLNEKLDALERTMMTASAELAGLSRMLPERFGTSLVSLTSLMQKLHADIDDERALIADTASNFSIDNAAINTPLTWQHALEFKRVGLDIGSNVNVGAGNSKTVVSAEPFGSGNFNTVHQLKFADGSAGIFKASIVDENPQSRAAVAYASMIPEEQPRYGARNVASSRLDKLLDTQVLADSEFFVHDGQLGVLMEKAEGAMLSALRAGPLRRMTPQLYKDLTALQVLDAVTGQHDRHFGNVIALADPAGNYISLKGIDNDNAFGANSDYNDLHDFHDIRKSETRRAMIQAGDFRGASYNVGMPPVIDAGLADKILADDFMSNVRSSVVGLLSAEEMEMLTDRMVQLREHVQELKDTGMTVSDWNSVQADNGRGLPRIFSKDARHSYVQALVKFTR